MKKAISFFSMLVFLGTTLSAHAEGSTKTSDGVSQPRVGVLLMAYGGSAVLWNEEVRHVADQVDLTYPTEIAFGIGNRSSMQSAIDRLAARKVTEIVAVPLFVSSHSSALDCIGYLLGVRAEAPEDLKMFAAHAARHEPSNAAEATRPVTSTVPIRIAPALDHHPLVADILRDRAASVSHDPAHEVVVMVAHGPTPESDNKLWLADMELLASEMKQKSQFARIEYLTLRDDAEDSVRDAASQELRGKVERATKLGNSALIVPLLISYGGIEDGIRKRLDGLSYRMPTQALLPDARIAQWVVESAGASR